MKNIKELGLETIQLEDQVLLVDGKKYYPVKFYEGLYSINEDGLIINTKTRKVIKHLITKKKYHRVGLYKNKKVKFYTVHRLMMLTFNFNENHFSLEINHIDGVKSNNNISNLEWCTSRENKDHAILNDLYPKGENHPLWKSHRSDSTKYKIKNSLLGNKHTDEAKLKMSMKRKGCNNSRAKKVINVETGKVYNCVKELWELEYSNEYSYDRVKSMLNGNKKSLIPYRYV